MKICMIGGSDVSRGQAWRSTMQQLRPDFEFVGSRDDGLYQHDGIGGNTSKQMLDRIADVPDCDVATILAGGNDLLQGVPNWATVNNVQNIVNALNARNITVYVMAIPPVNLGAEANSAILYLNLKLRRGITGAQEINLWEAVTKCGINQDLLYVDDKIHFTDIAYTDVLAPYTADNITTIGGSDV